MRVVVSRSRCIQQELVKARCCSILDTVERVQAWIEPFGGEVSVAAVNGPRSVTVSGPATALAKIEPILSAEGVMRRMIPDVDFAAHSAQVESLRDTLLEALDGIEARSLIPFYSTVTETAALDTTDLDAQLPGTELARNSVPATNHHDPAR